MKAGCTFFWVVKAGLERGSKRAGVNSTNEPPHPNSSGATVFLLLLGRDGAAR